MSFAICNVLLDVSSTHLPTSQLANVAWYDYLNTNTNTVHWVGSLWFGQFFATEADCDAVISTLAGIGVTGYKIEVTNLD
jgi:hypothetical protein